jgi:hypothetical protein
LDIRIWSVTNEMLNDRICFEFPEWKPIPACLSIGDPRPVQDVG